jgi:hypothetical protein
VVNPGKLAMVRTWAAAAAGNNVSEVSFIGDGRGPIFEMQLTWTTAATMKFKRMRRRLISER